jgi:hypothetical protein
MEESTARRHARPVPPGLADPDSLDAAIEALREGKRIDIVEFLNRSKLAHLKILLAEVQHLDFLSQAFFLGVSETCLRRWRTLLRSTKKLRKIDSSMGTR